MRQAQIMKPNSTIPEYCNETIPYKNTKGNILSKQFKKHIINFKNYHLQLEKVLKFFCAYPYMINRFELHIIQSNQKTHNKLPKTIRQKSKKCKHQVAGGDFSVTRRNFHLWTKNLNLVSGIFRVLRKQCIRKNSFFDTKEYYAAQLPEYACSLTKIQLQI